MQLARGTATGIGEYVAGLAESLRARGVDLVALQNAHLDPWRFDRRIVWDQVLLPLAAYRAGVDLLHCASGTMPRFANVPLVVTVHDVAWHRVQAHAKAYARAYFGRFALARYAGARRIVVDSQFSRDELLDASSRASCPLDPACVEVVFPGVAGDIMRLRRRRDDDAPYVLAVGTVEVRKNLAILVRALAAIPALRLISVGPPTPYLQTCLALARELGVAERFEVRGYVARQELLALYERALVAAVPSRYEGFGYGAAQALCAGVPLIASNAASLPEVVANAAPLVAADDAAAWVDALRAVVRERDAAEDRARASRPAALARFAWAACALRVENIYARALAAQ